jgi:bifunctional oligoribonuclease and PAP phosphatase NrnA
MNDNLETPPIEWSQMRALIDRYHDFVLTSHVRPDCDALGSELAMAGLLEALGKRVRIVNADPTPVRLAFLDPQRRIRVLDRDVDPSELAACDVIIVLDTGAWGQLGRMADVIRTARARVVVIDHHASDGEVAATEFKDPDAEATGRLVADLAEFLGLPMGPEIATPLFAALATDTGWFRFPSTQSSTYRVVARLIDAGAVPHAIYRQLYECDSPARVKLRARVLDRITTELAGRLAHTYVRGDDFVDTGADPSETEDFVNMALVIEGTEVAVLLIENPGGRIRVNFRSRSAFDCSLLAAQFDGGGHRAAAGATVLGEFPRVRDRVLDAVRAAMLEDAQPMPKSNLPPRVPGVADKRAGNS